MVHFFIFIDIILRRVAPNLTLLDHFLVQAILSNNRDWMKTTRLLYRMNNFWKNATVLYFCQNATILQMTQSLTWKTFFSQSRFSILRISCIISACGKIRIAITQKTKGFIFSWDVRQIVWFSMPEYRI